MWICVRMVCLSNILSRQNLYFPSNGFFCSPYATSHAFSINLNAACATADNSFQPQGQPLRKPAYISTMHVTATACYISLIKVRYKRKITVFVSHTNKTFCAYQGKNLWGFTSSSCMSLFLFCMSRSKLLLLLFRLI